MADSGCTICHANISMMSVRGQPFANVSMAVADISIDSVNIDQVNRSAGLHVNHTESLIGGVH